MAEWRGPEIIIFIYKYKYKFSRLAGDEWRDELLNS